jgi:hypothetical protein
MELTKSLGTGREGDEMDVIGVTKKTSLKHVKRDSLLTWHLSGAGGREEITAKLS